MKATRTNATTSTTTSVASPVRWTKKEAKAMLRATYGLRAWSATEALTRRLGNRKWVVEEDLFECARLGLRLEEWGRGQVTVIGCNAARKAAKVG